MEHNWARGDHRGGHHSIEIRLPRPPPCTGETKADREALMVWALQTSAILVDHLEKPKTESDRRQAIEHHAKVLFGNEQDRRDLRDRLYPQWRSAGPEERKAIENRIQAIVHNRDFN